MFPQIFTEIFLVLMMTSGALNQRLIVSPLQQVIEIGHNMTTLCKLEDRAIQYCRFAIPGVNPTFNLSPKTGTANFKYFGAGFTVGECGLTIEKVEEKHNGYINCSVGTELDIAEISGTTLLVVLRAPSQPELELIDARKYYNENEYLNATCIIRNGRPVPKISWFLDTILLKDDIHTKVNELGGDLYTVESNISYQIKASDEGKHLKCMTLHPGLTNKNNFAQTLIVVKFAPKPLDLPIQRFDLVEGTDVEIDVVVNANPQPDFIWTVGNSSLHEGDTSGRFTVLEAVKMENMSWKSILVINNLIENDVEKLYKLTARNDVGVSEYTIIISTNSRPKQEPELGSGIMIAVVIVVILLVIIVFVICVTRSRMHCCSTGHETHELDPIDFSSLFRLANDRTVPEVEDVGGEAGAPDSPEERDVVYAELDLKPRTQETLVRGSDKTEYAEIIHRQN